MQVDAGGVAIEVEVSGPPGGEPLLLIMGLGMQLTAWPDALVRLLGARGCRVVRFDNRDAGLSQGWDALGVPNLGRTALRYWLRLPVRTAYTLAQMADDAVAVLDALGIARGHVCGASMGGMLAQHVAARHPHRVKSLTLMMTTSGSRRLPTPAPRIQAALLQRPRGADRAAVVAHLVRLLTLIGSPAYRPEPALLQAHVEAMVARAWRPAGTARHLVAIAADGDRTPLLARIRVPTRVIHGLADPLVPPAAGHDLVRRIADAVADLIDGMGHDLPDALLPRFADGIAANAARA